MSPPILLDTCAVIWLAQGERLAPAALVELEQAYDRRLATLVSPITAWEVGMLIARGHLRPPMSPLAWLGRALAMPGIARCELSAEVLMASCFLPGTPPRDPADRMLAATAREGGYRLMTRDRAILAYAEQGHMQAIPC